MFAELKKNSILVVSALIIPIMILIVYWPDINILINEVLYDESVTHIVLVPIFASYIVYKKRNEIKASIEFQKFRNPSKDSLLTELIGVSLCLLALLTNWYGSNTFTPLEYRLFSLPILLMGVTLILFNMKTLRILIVPILFLFFLIPIPSEITYTAGAILGNFNTQTAYILLKLVGLPVILDPTYGSPIIALNNASDTSILFSVDLACSGIYSLIAFIMFATFLAYIMYGSIFKKAAIFLVGFLVMQVLNIIRIFSIVVAGHWFGEEIAMTLVHITAGWILICCGMFIILLISEKLFHLKLFQNSNKLQSCSKCSVSFKKYESFCLYCGKFFETQNINTRVSRIFLVKLFSLLISLLVITAIMQVPAFVFAKGLTITDPNLKENIEVFPEYNDHEFRFLYQDVKYEKLSEQDFSLMYAYVSLNNSTPTVYVDLGIANTLSNLHNWEVCYVTYQTAHDRSTLVSVIDSRDVRISENPNIIGRYFIFESPNNYTQVTLYWYATTFFNSGLSIEKRFVRISLIILTQHQTSYNIYEEKLLEVAQSISEYWEPLITQNLFSLSVPLQQVLLVATTFFIISSGTVEHIRKLRRKEVKKRVFENYGSESDKFLFKTIHDINEGTGATTKEIAQAVERINGNPPDLDELINKIKYLQENAILDIELVLTQNNPHVVWKP